MGNAQNKSKGSALSEFGLLLALLASATAVFAGVGTRFELWFFRTGLNVLRWAAYGGAAAAALSLLGVIFSLHPFIRRNLLWALAGLIIGTMVAGVPWYWMEKSKGLPHIHDITTDTNNPPQFVTVLPLRRNASNPAQYGGSQLAAQQRKAYKDIVPLFLKLPPEKAFGKALAAGRGMGWTIVDENPETLRIEATDSTLWFGFKDDIVIRIQKQDSGSRVDIRSASRVGISDIGTNAKRIRLFLKRMQGQ